ncbi:MAG: DUF6049 family protein [Actinomycetota bacterium]
MLPLRRAAAILFVCCLSAPLPIASAQIDDDSPGITLVRQPTWHDRGDPLGLRLTVDNLSTETLEGFLLHIALYPRLVTRSDLHESFDGVSGFEIGSFRKGYSDATLQPGESRTVTIKESISPFVGLDQLGENGVYPLTISLLDSSGALLDSLTTELIYYESRPDTPLNLVLVVPLTAPPARGPDRLFRAVGEAPPLEEAVLEDGYLRGIVTALSDAHDRGLRFAVIPNARLLEELADMADGYRRDAGADAEELGRDSPASRGATALLDDIRGLTGERGVQEILAPYSFADLTALIEHLPDGVTHLTSQLSAAEEVVSQVLGLDLQGEWLFAPGGRLDRPTLDALLGLGVASFSLFSAEALTGPADPAVAGCPEGSPSLACPVQVESSLGKVRGFVSDEEMDERFTDVVREPDSALDLQRLFAETAMIREELPGAEGRAVLASVPAGWHLDPRISTRLFAGMARAPWIDTVAPRFALDRVVPPASRSIVEELPAARGEPDPFYYSDIAQARDSVESFAAIQPPAQLIDSYRRDLLVAEARSWWAAPDLTVTGRLYARSTREAIEQELGRLTIVGEDVITLTSRRGVVQVTIINENDYPATLQVNLASQQLTVDEVPLREFEPGVTSIQVDVTAQSSGIFPLQVTLETPRGDAIGSPRSFQIRSTELNEIALAITLGAFAFLVSFYVIRAVRGRKRSSEATSA